MRSENDKGFSPSRQRGPGRAALPRYYRQLCSLRRDRTPCFKSRRQSHAGGRLILRGFREAWAKVGSHHVTCIFVARVRNKTHRQHRYPPLQKAQGRGTRESAVSLKESTIIEP